MNNLQIRVSDVHLLVEQARELLLKAFPELSLDRIDSLLLRLFKDGAVSPFSTTRSAGEDITSFELVLTLNVVGILEFCRTVTALDAND
ncbi:hypothetical protein V757_01030 [Pelistega indica]|uniref:Uncharacterized protein n=1 Tax=Pelistega indica TaxID=1414851 RepID=V8GA68_9BURK|nr:hypothetical protein [Pelistega indica]ETD72991.1 hypothetical protein V757_01030 [Pelistega indica]